MAASSSERKGQEAPEAADDEDGDDDAPVDVDFNLVQNLISSYEAQQGQAGPTGSLLASLGLRLPTPAQPPAQQQTAPDS